MMKGLVTYCWIFNFIAHILPSLIIKLPADDMTDRSSTAIKQ